jgi:transglutaminase-like putative cysteine protease
VVEPPAPQPGLTPAVGGRRDQLLDLQTNCAQARPQTFVRLRSVALDAAALGSVSQPQIHFNPAYQTVVVHSVAVWREGRRTERLASARIELLRRELGLDSQVLDGGETLLMVLSDVRLNEPVEVVYSVEGENPIFEGRIAASVRLAYDTPVDLLHYRLIVPADRALQVKTLASDLVPERSVEGGTQVLRMLRHQVAAVASEQHTVPWFKAYPALLVTDYRDWAEVDAWAQRLFAQPSPMHATVVARAEAFRATGLQGAALVSEVLRFVQDEVRYFSVSLGESSHRPKPPQQTLAELLGDCKDKVQLLNALLRELGFDARPALVSTVRNRGLAEFLPGHGEFDHVVTALELDGRSWWLDGTLNGQGLELATRGRWAYGMALVVGGSGQLVPVAEAPDALDRLQFEQRWDLSKPGRPARVTSVLRAHGQEAERWRARAAAEGVLRLAEPLAGAIVRMAPGLEAAGAPVLEDDRRANVLQLTQHFSHADLGLYSAGSLSAEFSAVEMLDLLKGPPELRRRTPYLLDLPRSVDSRIVVVGMQPTPTDNARAEEVGDRHFRYISRIEASGNTVAFVRRLERRADQVLPADLDGFRENLLRARSSASSSLSLALFDFKAAEPELVKLERRVLGRRQWRNDAFGAMQLAGEMERDLDTRVLAVAEPQSSLAARVLATRAAANNMLGELAAALVDADAALAIRPASDAGLHARAVALLGLGRAEASLASFTQSAARSRSSSILGWMGALNYHLGRHAEAESLLREAVDSGAGREREVALLWLYLATEQLGGRGQATLAGYADGADPGQVTGALLRYFSGTLDRDAVLQLVREKPELERFRVVEVTFFVGQQFAARGQPDEARRWLTRTVEAGGAQIREVIFAQQELARGK